MKWPDEALVIHASMEVEVDKLSYTTRLLTESAYNYQTSLIYKGDVGVTSHTVNKKQHVEWQARQGAVVQSFHFSEKISHNDNGTDSHLIFSYGTLKRGFLNHHLIESLMANGDVILISKYTTVSTFPLVCRPYGIPYLINIPGSGHRVWGEPNKMKPNGLGLLADLEGIERLPVSVVGGDEAAEAYFVHRIFGGVMWKRCGEVGLEEFSVGLGEKIVRKEDRPSNRDFIQDISNFFHNGDT
ncbi:putative gamma-glutamylcyclotransferase At3g02910 [Lycium barbarum]|uniref:putative gamma-glutamylcyclotransferase At3g02910 n=1 Tax=Lycium barbarum TaxID=112863 RepID=UPI00293E5920|nr:putative gamma-glutamylcyclotransferase At3g02910 [Lycium barbarum]